MKIISYCLLISIIVWSCKSAAKSDSRIIINKEYLENRLTELSSIMESKLSKFPIDSLNIPRAMESDGTIIAGKSRQWTSGFFPGTLWQLASQTQSPSIIKAAEQWTSFVEKEKWDDHTHDLGFKVNSAFGKMDLVKPSANNKEIIIQASKTLIDRFIPKVGSIRSWDFGRERWQFPVIIDNMMNLEMLFDATEFSEDSIYYDVAHKHGHTTLKNHFRADHSSYHVIDYDTLTGEVRNRHTHQGLNHESSWSRGQAWGLYGFAMAYDRTGDRAFFDQASNIASFFFNHPNLPEDMIPYWDFDASNIPDEPKDASAAAVAAVGLMKLAKYDTENRVKYMEWVDTILSSLGSPEYQSDAVPFLLDHSTGSVPGDFEIDVPIVYGDFYYVEALITRLNSL
jgi:hypothetical protein